MAEAARRYLFVSQPYEHAHTENALREMRETCAEHGVEMFTSMEMSWWFPGRTMLVVVGKPLVLREVGLSGAGRLDHEP